MRTRHPFSLIEIMLALGVCVIGICAVMVLFPVGANASRDAAMETYAAHAADQMLHSLKHQLRNVPGAWTTLIGDAADGSEGELPLLTDVNSTLTYTLAQLDDSTVWDDATASQPNLFKFKGDPDVVKGVYQMISHRLDSTVFSDIIAASDKIDYRGLVQVWKEPITVQGTSLPYALAVKLNVQVSWPPMLLPAARQKSYYTLEVFKPN